MYKDLTKYENFYLVNKEKLERDLSGKFKINFALLGVGVLCNISRADIGFCYLEENKIFTIKDRYTKPYQEYEVDEAELARILLLNG